MADTGATAGHDDLQDRLAEIHHDEYCDCGHATHWRAHRSAIAAFMPTILAVQQQAVDEALEGAARSVEAARRPGWQAHAAHIRSLTSGAIR